MQLNPTVLRKAKIVYNFGVSECNRVKQGKKTLINIQIKAALWKPKVSVSAPDNKG